MAAAEVGLGPGWDISWEAGKSSKALPAAGPGGEGRLRGPGQKVRQQRLRDRRQRSEEESPQAVCCPDLPSAACWLGLSEQGSLQGTGSPGPHRGRSWVLSK